MLRDFDILDRDTIAAYLSKKGIHQEVVYYDSISSTITVAKEHIKNGFTGIIVAEQQTVGRGTKGRSFISSQGGIYFSIVQKIDDAPSALKDVLRAGVAVSLTLEKLGFAPQLKWPNDVFLSSKKICGILCETVSFGDEKRLIAGVGVNVNTRSFMGEVEKTATSMYLESGKEFDRAEILVSIVDFFSRIEDVELFELYRKRSNTLGREITVIESGNQYRATAVDIDEDGFLVVSAGNGLKKVISGDVSIRI